MTETTVVIDRILESIAPFVPRLAGAFVRETPLQRLTVSSSTQVTKPIPAMFQPMFYVVLQGTRALTIGGKRFELGPGDCAASSFGLPYVGEVADATRTSPYVSLKLDIDVDLLTEVMLDLPEVEGRVVCSAAEGRLEGSLGDALVRLVGLVNTPNDRLILARHYEIELYYRLLQSPMGDTLRQLGQRDNRIRQIKTAADWLAANPHKPVIVAELAASVGMSLTSFHRHFRAVTGYSPLAFQRRIRLLDARRLLVAGGINVARVAHEVGYVSPSQFSREYKTMFGSAPAAHLARSNVVSTGEISERNDC